MMSARRIDYLDHAVDYRAALEPHALANKRRKYRATFQHEASTRDSVERALFVSVYDVATGALVTEHIWMPTSILDRIRIRKGESPDEVAAGDVLEFWARAAVYVKGRAREEGVFKDYHLINPSHVRVVAHASGAPL